MYIKIFAVYETLQINDYGIGYRRCNDWLRLGYDIARRSSIDSNDC